MPSRTQIVCMCEGSKGRSIDGVFINRLIKSLDPGWLKPQGSNKVRLVPCDGRKTLIEKMPAELRVCLNAGGDSSLMVWSDCDDNCADGEALKALFWCEADRQKITREQFDRVVFIFAKDRLENWIEFLTTGETNESKEGPRVKHDGDVRNAAKKLAEFCKVGKSVDGMPKSLEWSCRNWRALAKRMG